MIVDRALTVGFAGVVGAGRAVVRTVLGAELARLQQAAGAECRQRCAIPLALDELLAAYSSITDADLVTISSGIVEGAAQRLKVLSETRRSDELSTAEFYRWLIDAMERAEPGSRIWAVSLMLDCEWDESQAERQFLELNIAAVKRKVYLERVFIVEKAAVAKFLLNTGVRAHLDYSDEYMQPKVVDRDVFASAEPGALKQIGDGLIAFDRRVAQIDIARPGLPISGVVTMNTAEIVGLRTAFEVLLRHSRDLREFAAHAQSEAFPR